MSRGVGALQRKLLNALYAYGRESSLDDLAYFAAGIIPDLTEETWHLKREGTTYGAATYKATARAVRGLETRGLVTTTLTGTTREKTVYRPTGSGGAQRESVFSNPTTALSVRSVGSKC